MFKTCQSILEELNPEQKKAVAHPFGPLLVLAGAGSGKTRVLTHRIAYLIAQGVLPRSILAVTFTNKAAGEMKGRVAKLVGPGATQCWIGTFHSISARILRRECERLGYMPNYTIYDANDQKRLIKKIIERLGFSERRLPISLVHSKISNAKNHLVDWKSFERALHDPSPEKIAAVYKAYQQDLQAANAVDFDDLIMLVVQLLRRCPDLCEKYQRRFQHVLVDEYQDTNVAQFHWIRMMTTQKGCITVVGDDDQSIYGWRGANLDNILSFEKHFPDAGVYRLEQNYRSTPQILQAANSMIAKNAGRKEKALWTQNPSGSKVMVSCVDNETAEAEAVAELVSKGEGRFSDYCVLYRTNAQSRALEDAMRLRGIPYVIVGGLRFYERKEVKDILAYLYVLINPQDNLSLLRIINVPKRGIGNRTIAYLEEFAEDHHMDIYTALSKAQQIAGISPAAAKRLAMFRNILGKFKKTAQELPPVQVVEMVIEQTGYLEELDQLPTEEAEERKSNVEELIHAVEAFSARSESRSLQAFLEEVALITDIDTWDKEKDAVSLMTLHCAKGLEFPVVFITGLEQGLLPISRSLEDDKLLEEERRLFYVGITRAQRDVRLYYTRNRRRFGMDMPGLRSMFVDELDKKAVVRMDLAEPKTPVRTTQTTKQASALVIPNYEDFSQEEKTYQVGGYVRHPSWGNGRILDISGFGLDARLTILFGSTQKKVLVRYANLDIL